MEATAIHLDPQTVIAAGVAAHLLLFIAKGLFHSPKQRAQISAIERKVDEVLASVRSA